MAKYTLRQEYDGSYAIMHEGMLKFYVARTLDRELGEKICKFLNEEAEKKDNNG